MKYPTVICLLIACLLSSGCGNNSLQPMSLSEAYPGNIMKVDRIQIFNGDTGESVVIDDKNSIHNWLEQVKDVVCSPNPDQSEKDGFLFGAIIIRWSLV